MTEVILFQPEGKPAAIIYPAPCGLSVEQIGQKDVPVGLPFWIVPASNIPTDRTFRDAWELDVARLGEPSGFGGAA